MANNTFDNIPVLAWAIDTFEALDSIIRGGNSYLSREVQEYREDFYEKNIEPLFESAPIKLNLGGKEEKQKLKAIDRPIGVFDFSLASMGMYPVPEFYSQKLADEKPYRFVELGLVSGIVPNNLVQEKIDKNTLEKIIYFHDVDKTKYPCVIRKKGQTEIDDGVQGAKLKFATKNKKVYLTYNRNRGRVKYVELYSLFDFAAGGGELGYAIRHIPALMVAEYLETIGTKVRFYMTRFVKLRNETITLREVADNKMVLPQYELTKKSQNSRGDFASALLIQPIIVKEFGQALDKNFALAISQRESSNLYTPIVEEAVEKETKYCSDVFGQPRWSKSDYLEGFERYRNKYMQYVDLGIFKSKETLPEAMIMFEDETIVRKIQRFFDILKMHEKFLGSDTAKQLMNPNINLFFNWWMRISATVLKDKISIINSNDYYKDLLKIKATAEEKISELKIILSQVDKGIKSGYENLAEQLTIFGNDLLEDYSITNSAGNFSFYQYITDITTEITTYADGKYYQTTPEEKERRNKIVENVLETLDRIEDIK